MDQIANLDDSPERPWPYLWADFIEIVCLSTLDKVATAQTLRSGYLGQDVSGEDTELFDDADLDLANGADARPRRADKFERLIDDGFQHAEDRQRQFGNLYPFEVDKSARRLSLKTPLSEGNKLYVALLLSANHKYLPGQQHALTTGFEVISWHALKALLPTESDVRLAGTTHANSPIGIPSASSRKPDKLRGMVALARTGAEINDAQFWPNDTADEGADLFAVVPFGEPETAEEIIVLGQCATSNENWGPKQNDASPQKWAPLLGMPVPNMNFLFLAASPRQYGNKFERGVVRSGHAVWVDRQRILKRLNKLVERTATPASALMSTKVWDLVTKAVEASDIVAEHPTGHSQHTALV